jgi:excisionase family DNA binding protein
MKLATPMSDRVLVPLSDGRWLALEPVAFREALEAGQRVMAPQSGSSSGGSPDEPLLNAGELAKALQLPKSCVYERARTGAFPSVRVGKHVRFRRSAVLEALGATAPQQVVMPKPMNLQVRKCVATALLPRERYAQ